MLFFGNFLRLVIIVSLVKTNMHVHQTTHEIQENLSLLYQQLVHHSRNAKNTEKTLIYLLKSEWMRKKLVNKAQLV